MGPCPLSYLRDCPRGSSGNVPLISSVSVHCFALCGIVLKDHISYKVLIHYTGLEAVAL